MRQDSRDHIRQAKINAKKRYAERQVDKFVKWSLDVKGKVKYKELMEVINMYK
jgi:hypothetical protein